VLARRVHRIGQNAPIDQDASVRAVLARHPHLHAVFARHGLGGCGGAAGPDESIALFATMHRVDLRALVDELNRATEHPPDAEARASGTPEPASDLLYCPFIIAALLATLTLGATFGAYNLACVQLALGPIPPPHNWVHASFQIFGFVLLFIMGIGYHAVPRFLGAPLPSRPLAAASLWLIIGGIFLRTYGQLGVIAPATSLAHGLGATALLAGTVTFGGSLVLSFRRARARLELFHLYLGIGTAAWIVAAGLCFSAEQGSEMLYQVALFGGALSWIQGMLLRVGAGFLGLQPPRTRLCAGALALGTVGLALVLLGHAAAPLFVAADVVLFAYGARLLSRRVHRQDLALARISDLAIGWSIVFALLAAAWSIDVLTGQAPPSLLWDAARHAFGLGFVTLMIFALAGRVLPIFGGSELAWPRLRWYGACLIAIGVAARQMELVATLAGAPSLLVISGTSGIVAAVGVFSCAVSIWVTLARAGRSLAVARPIAIDEAALVGPLIDAHPELLPVLIAAGFGPLANPIARRTIARAVSLGTACALHRIDLASLLERLRAACVHPVAVTPAASLSEDAPIVPLSRLTRPIHPQRGAQSE
jgi:hypothetical protein